MMPKLAFRFYLMQPQVVLLEWDSEPSEALLCLLIAFKKEILLHSEDVIQITQGYCSLMVFYKNKINSPSKFKEILQSLYENIPPFEIQKGKLWKIPVYYGKEFGIDLEVSAQKLQMSVKELVKTHHSVCYLVYFIGFLPGFLYLYGLPKILNIPRKSKPSPKVSPGSIGIGGQQTGIYPQESPGGWHIIGRTPYPLFQPSKKSPCFAQAGDQIEFYPITKSEYKSIEKGIDSKTYKIKSV